MNRLDKLTEATILALQGKLNLKENKLVEKENSSNREINAKIRQGYDYIDDINNVGLNTFVEVIDTKDDEIPSDFTEKYSIIDDDYADYMVQVTSQKEYNQLRKDLPTAEWELLVCYTEPDGPMYCVDKATLYGIDTELDVTKDTDIYNFLVTKDSRSYDQDGNELNNSNYSHNAKHSEDTLNNTPKLRQRVKDELDDYKNSKTQATNLSKELDQLQKTNVKGKDNKFVNDNAIIDKSKELGQVKDKVRKLSKDDGSFDTATARDEWNNIKTV